MEVPREPGLTTEHEEEIHSEERGGFEAHSEQPVLSPIARQETLAPRGKQRDENEENNNFELLSLL